MKRTVPLFITAIAGFILVVSVFVPRLERFGEDAAKWFDMLAAIAFILGGGNLLRVHLKKISDRVAGWGYSGVTLAAFLLTLTVGLLKVGVAPEGSTEFYGESFVDFPLELMPEYRLPGTIPVRPDGEPLPASVRRNVRQVTEQQQTVIVFQGWMSNRQRDDLLDYHTELRWQCLVEELYQLAQPPESFEGRVTYHNDHHALGFQGRMSESMFAELMLLFGEDSWGQRAIDMLRQQSVREISLVLPPLPPNFSIPAEAAESLTLDGLRLTIVGPMSTELRDQLADEWPRWERLRPLTEATRAAEIEQTLSMLESQGSALNAEQREQVERLFATLPDVRQLIEAVNVAGQSVARKKTACELLAEQMAGATVLNPEHPRGNDVTLTDEQVQAIRDFVANPAQSLDELIAQLNELSPLTSRMTGALRGFINRMPTQASFRRDVGFAALRKGHLTPEQREWVFGDYRREFAWRSAVEELFLAAHIPKFPWSGSHEQEGSAFWWAYAYLFRPLVATMFAMLAFYVASAAFRAFRAKNFEALLLLGTAFIILLGRTFIGVALTSWVPPWLSVFKLDELTVYVMQIFNTAGNRAIMIGIALGVASTSLKVLLGVDRSYLGSGDD